jgi:plastocyanin
MTIRGPDGVVCFWKSEISHENRLEAGRRCHRIVCGQWQCVSPNSDTHQYLPDELRLRSEHDQFEGRDDLSHAITNDGSKGHNFNAPQFFAGSQIARADAGKVDEGSVELDSGEAVDVTVTPNRAGTYRSDCTHFMHSMLGMHGKIIVQ